MIVAKDKSKYIDSIQEASPTVLECRELGHAWKHVDDGWLVQGASGDIIQFSRDDKCLRCDCRRERVFEVATMTIVRSKMHYEDGYLGRKGLHLKRSDARHEAFRRVVTKAHRVMDSEARSNA